MTPQCAVEAGLSCGDVAQLVERLLCKQDVRSSNLLGSTNIYINFVKTKNSFLDLD